MLSYLPRSPPGTLPAVPPPVPVAPAQGATPQNRFTAFLLEIPMAIDPSELERVATLARIRLDADAVPELTQRLSAILGMVGQMSALDTSGVQPMSNPHDAVQRLRADRVTETDQRDAFQAIAPLAENGLYLVPKVIE